MFPDAIAEARVAARSTTANIPVAKSVGSAEETRRLGPFGVFQAGAIMEVVQRIPRRETKIMKTHPKNPSAQSPSNDHPIDRPWLVNFVCSPDEEFPDQYSFDQCFTNQRQIIINSTSPEDALLAATEVLKKAYPHPFTITRVEDENCLKFGLALIEKSKNGNLSPASAQDDEEDWERFAQLE